MECKNEKVKVKGRVKGNRNRKGKGALVDINSQSKKSREVMFISLITS